MTAKGAVFTELMQAAIKTKSAAAMVAVVALAGCATTTPPAAETKRVAEPAPSTISVETEFSKVARSIDANLKRLTEIEETARKAPPTPKPRVPEGPLTQRVSVLWKGPAEGILAKVAEDTGFRFKTVGKEPAIPLIVNIDVKNEQVVEVLRSIGLQLGAAANVNVSLREKVIEVVYAGS